MNCFFPQDTPTSFLLKTLHTPEIIHSVQATFQKDITAHRKTSDAYGVCLTVEESQLAKDIPLKGKAHGFTKAVARQGSEDSAPAQKHND